MHKRKQENPEKKETTVQIRLSPQVRGETKYTRFLRFTQRDELAILNNNEIEWRDEWIWEPLTPQKKSQSVRTYD